MAGLRKLAVAGLTVVGLWASIATSPAPSDEGGWDETGGEGYEDVEGNVVVNNANDYDVALYVRPLRDDVELNCGAVANNPSGTLPEQAFGDAVHWVLPPWTNLGIEVPGPCGAAWVAGEGIPPQLLFWWKQHNPGFYPGQYFDLSELPEAATAVVFEGSGAATWHGGEGFRFTPASSVPELPASCEPSSTSRLEWDSNVPVQRPLELVGRDYGPDGCFELELLDLLEPATTWTSYLCAPEHALAFVVGERLRFDFNLEATDPPNSLRIRLLDPDTLYVERDEQERAVREVHLIRAAPELATIDLALGHDLQASPRVTCPWQWNDDCANTEQPFDVRVAETEQLVAAGDAPVKFEEPGYEREFTLVHAQKRAVSDGACGAVAGLDLDVVITSAVVP